METANGTGPDELDDPELMRQAGAGFLGAFECLVRRHQQPLLNFFRRMGAHTDAEDMVQETLVRVFRYRSRYQPTAKFTTFLYTVARHVWLDGLRKARRAEALAARLDAEADGTDDGDMVRAQSRLDVEAALCRLPEKLRSVVVLAVHQGLRYEEIAKVLDIPVGTVKSRVFAAVAKLRESLR